MCYRDIGVLERGFGSVFLRYLLDYGKRCSCIFSFVKIVLFKVFLYVVNFGLVEIWFSKYIGFSFLMYSNVGFRCYI